MNRFICYMLQHCTGFLLTCGFSDLSKTVTFPLRKCLSLYERRNILTAIPETQDVKTTHGVSVLPCWGAAVCTHISLLREPCSRVSCLLPVHPKPQNLPTWMREHPDPLYLKLTCVMESLRTSCTYPVSSWS